MIVILSVLCSAIVTAGAYTLVRRMILKGRKEAIIAEAEREGEAIKQEKILQAKEKFLQLKSEHEQKVNERNKALSDAENRLRQKENSLNQQNSELGRKNKELEAIRENLKNQLDIAKK